MARGALRGKLRWVWRWSLVATVPISCLFVLWMVRTGKAYVALGLRFETVGEEVDLKVLADYEGEVLRREIALALQPESTEEPRQLRSMRLYVPEASESALDSALPHSGKTYVPASMVYPDGELREVKLRYRGDHYWHWAGRKKSLRIKTKKSQLFERIRSINLSTPKLPDQISGYLSYFLADQFDLITPRYELVDLHVNGSYRGMFLLLEQLEEMVIRKHGRMPGDVYAADVVGRDAYRGLNRRAFENPGLWRKIAINNHFEEEEIEALERLVRVLVDPPSLDRSLELRSLLDIDAFARFAAFRAMCQSEHYDETHNWRLYYDPWRNRFEPIVWDPVGWAAAWVPKEDEWARPDIVSSRLDEALMQDQVFLAARQAAIEDYFTKGGFEDLVAELDRTVVRTRASIATDPAPTYKIEALDTEEVYEAQAELRRTVLQIGEQLRQVHLGRGRVEFVASASVPTATRVSVHGRRILSSLEIEMSGVIDGPVTAHVAYRAPDGARRADVSGAVVQRGTTVELQLGLAAQFVPVEDPGRKSWLSPAYSVVPGFYDVVLSGPAVDGLSVLDVRGHFANGDSVRGRAVSRMMPVPFQNAQAIIDPVPAREPLVWEGSRDIDGVTRISEDVILRPGVTLRMGPEASLIFEGKVLARGTADRPVRILRRSSAPDDPLRDVPWGVIAIRGEGADNSELSHCEFDGGSGLKVPMAEFSAMLSIHDVDSILIRDCAFRDSQVVDDMVHTVYSTVTFKGCTFERSLFDALDLDITTGVVEDCRFIDSGNDALDLMTSVIQVRDCWIEGSVDKGVSVGEDTEATIVRTMLRDCEIGIQIKDRSRAVVYNSELDGNRLGIDAYKKNWRYDSGGFGFVYKSMFARNGVVLGADKHSRILVHDCGFDGRIESDDRVRIDGSSDFDGRRAAKVKRLRRFPEEEAGASPALQSAWATVDPRRRGLPKKP